jgi:beta-N-acetylhexosaminidase
LSDASSRPPCRAAIVGIADTRLRPEERRLIAAHDPLGFILFARNCRTPDQVGALVADLRATVGRDDALVLLDQEGGRVARLRPPHWPEQPPARAIGRLAEVDRSAGREAAWLQARLLAADLAPLGITVDCAPVLDLAWPGRTAAIGDRAFSADPKTVGLLGEAALEGFLAGGVLPVIKHLPGHGRARVDSHLELPVVSASRQELAASDWRPFQICRGAPFGMTAHVLYPALDPDWPATHSAHIIDEVIRGAIGFEGILLSDDLSMQALGGGLGERCARALAAGCDVALHCNGELAEMVEVLETAPRLTAVAVDRLEKARVRLGPAPVCDLISFRAQRDALLASHSDLAVSSV